MDCDVVEQMWADQDVVLKRVRKAGLLLAHASTYLRGSREVVLEAVRQNGLALMHASAELRADLEVVLEAVRQNGVALRHAGVGMRGSAEVGKAAVQQNGLVLLHASDEVCSDREVVLRAVRQNGLALQHALGEVVQSMGEVGFQRAVFAFLPPARVSMPLGWPLAAGRQLGSSRRSLRERASTASLASCWPSSEAPSTATST